ncbi:MAG TPA: isochorismatase [Syntrophobacteria bacterium]|nr:isochorismatase [Syntrophobacteria bacterium]
MVPKELPLPPHYDTARVGEIWRVPYEERARDAAAWAGRHGIQPASRDAVRIALMLVDLQNTFCIPGFELFVGGRSGMGAVEDNRRLCAFIYRNLHVITQTCPTMDTHRAFQIFHSIFLINDRGERPQPFTPITADDIANGTWRLNPEVAHSLGISDEYGKQHLLHYTSSLKAGGKYDLTIWPYHAMLGGIGHALVPAVEEAVFFHSIARYSQPDFQVKGDNSLTENYSVLRPEIMNDAAGAKIADKNVGLIEKLLDVDAVIIGGQARSHCLAWTVEDLLSEILAVERSLTKKVYLLEDCSSPVVVPGVVDYTDQADAAFRKFAKAGMHLVRASDPIASWPGILGRPVPAVGGRT